MYSPDDVTPALARSTQVVVKPEWNIYKLNYVIPSKAQHSLKWNELAKYEDLMFSPFSIIIKDQLLNTVCRVCGDTQKGLDGQKMIYHSTHRFGNGHHRIPPYNYRNNHWPDLCIELHLDTASQHNHQYLNRIIKRISFLNLNTITISISE